MAESVAKSLPAVLQGVLASLSLPGQNELKDNVNTKSTDATTVPTTLRGDRLYNTEQETVISQRPLSFTNKAFSRSLSKDKWKELTTSYTQIKDTESLLVAPTIEDEMKEELKKRHGYTKTKDLFSFDDGLAERQSAFLVVAALTALDNSEGEDDDEGPDPDAIKDLLEEALVLLRPGGKNASLSSSLKLVNKLCGKVTLQISTFSRTSFMQRSRVKMTIAQLTASLSAHQPRNTSPKDHA